MTDTIRRTRLTGVEVVTIKSDNEHAYHPFQVYVVIDGIAGHRSHFRTKAAADHHHQVLVDAEVRQTREGGSMSTSASVSARRRRER